MNPEIKSDPCIQRLFSRRTVKLETELNYLKGIDHFCKFTGLTPCQVVEKAKVMSEDELVNWFREFFVAKKDSLAPKTLWNFTLGIKALLIENGVKTVDRVSREIAREFRRTIGPVRTLLKRDIITKEEIVQVLKVAPLREKAIIALMASSGLRVSAALNLKIENFKDNLWDESLPCYAIEIPESLSKEGEPYITFCSWEAALYIREFIKFRESQEENVKPSSYIFTAYQEERPLSVSRFETYWRDICREAGVDLRPVKIKGKHTKVAKGGVRVYSLDGKRYNVRPHSLRKFFRTSLAISGVDRLAAEALMGHSLLSFGVESIYNYAVSRLDYLRGEYLKALNNLLFLKEPRGMEIINGVARERIKQLEEKVKSFEILQAKVESLEEAVKFYEALIKKLQKKNPRLLKELGID
jgi:integrase